MTIAIALASFVLGVALTICALKPRATQAAWSLGPISYVRSGQISSLSLGRFRRMRAGQIVKWARAA